MPEEFSARIRSLRERGGRVYDLLTPELRRRAPVVFVAMLLSAVLQLVGVGSVLPFLQVVSDPSIVESTRWMNSAMGLLGLETTDQFLIAMGAGVLVLVVVSNFVMAISEWMQVHFHWDVTYALSTRLLETYLGQDYEYFLNRNTATLKRNILSETRALSAGVIEPPLRIVSRGLVVLALVGLVFYIDPLAALVVLSITGGGYLGFFLYIRRRLSRSGQTYVAANDLRYKAAQESLDGVKDAKLLGRERSFVDIFEPAARDHADSLARKQMYQILPRFAIEAFAFGSLMAVLLFFLASGRSVSSIIPIMGTFAFAGYRLFPSLRGILGAAANLEFHDTLLEEIHADLAHPTSEPEALRRSQPEPIPLREEIDLESVTFRYPGAESPSVRDIDLSIDKDASVGIVGETGAGKTTLVDILLGLLYPQTGELKVDGQMIGPNEARRWRRSIGYVPQEIYLTDDTVRRNIAFGVPEEDIDDEAVERAARVAHIHRFVTSELPEGYDTKIGERGVRLSGGQCQRIGIARALYHDPEVLVFDEATSDIDGETEAMISRAIRELSGDKTLVVIAHRLETIRDCDEVYMLRDGKIVAAGTYEELLNESRQFAAMVEGTVLETSPGAESPES